MNEDLTIPKSIALGKQVHRNGNQITASAIQPPTNNRD